jgi:hypothetical protein
MSVRYTSYNKAWCDAVEAKLKAQGAVTSREMENVTHESKEGKVCEIKRDTSAAGKDAVVKRLYVVVSNKELKS